ncbi:hypothetical protein RVIR1_04720 [Candidatus Rickettsiella viridis]|uniref:Uncharacterized protein n=1 Tax=Candidatus Rickettsiella viridis TaxID=676208 RepID=A0A2Z5UVJ6_9COXI|nr:hypothetical protein RVIR1_04720 [Candidatus Rickettsiella viridis]
MRAGLAFSLVFIFAGPIKGIFASIQDTINKSNNTNIKFKDLDIDFSTNNQLSPINQMYKRDLEMAFQSPVISRDETFLIKRLIEAKLSPDDQTDVLIRLLANTRLNLFMLLIDKQVSEEQIGLLSYLNDQTIPIEQTKLLPFFKKWQKKSKNNSYAFTQFLNVLLALNLIAENVSSYTITPLGKEYLIFRVRFGHPINFDNIPSSKNKLDMGQQK